MDIADALQSYFGAERLTGIVLAVYGVALFGFATFLYHAHSGQFMWSLAVPLAIIGLLAAGGGGWLAAKTGPQLAALKAMAGPDLLAAELPRMAKVNANWLRLEITWTVIIVGSLAMLWLGKRPGLAERGEWTTGLSLALLIAASSAMVLDVLAERRAKVYTAALERLSP
jgi:hypothetical protein